MWSNKPICLSRMRRERQLSLRTDWLTRDNKFMSMHSKGKGRQTQHFDLLTAVSITRKAATDKLLVQGSNCPASLYISYADKAGQLVTRTLAYSFIHSFNNKQASEWVSVWEKAKNVGKRCHEKCAWRCHIPIRKKVTNKISYRQRLSTTLSRSLARSHVFYICATLHASVTMCVCTVRT